MEKIKPWAAGSTNIMEKKEEHIDNSVVEKIIGIADVVDFESNKGMIKITFFISFLDKSIFANHMMKVAEVVLDANTAGQVAAMLKRHADRGSERAVPTITRVALPDEVVELN